ncbi:MAG TPA: hypothetical protein VGB27_08385 [Candidatus Binatia bacterium]|jgi:hypothetical protein
MKLATLKPNDLAIINGETMISVGDVLPAGATMIDLIAAYDGARGKLETLAASGGGKEFGSKNSSKPPWKSRRRSAR